MSEHDISDMENSLPALSGVAFQAARKQTLASGQSVLESEKGVIYEVLPSGEARAVKKIAPPILVKKGAKIRLR